MRQEPIVDDRLKPMMDEREPVTDALQHAATHQLLDPFCGRHFVQTTRIVEQRELELASDHRRHRRELAGRPAQPLQAGRDHRPHALGQRETRRPLNVVPSRRPRMVSTTTNGLPSLRAQTCSSSAASSSTALPTRTRERMRAIVSAGRAEPGPPA